MSILCIGQSVYDITFPCEESIIENQKYRIYDRLECMGAPAANAAYLCALWGADTYLMARVGNDLFGKEIQRQLEEVKVHTETMLIDQNNPTSISCIITNTANGNRTILNSPMKETAYPINYPKQDIDIILMDGHELQASLDAIQHYPNAITVLDAGTYKPEIMELLHAVEYLVCSQDFAYQYTNIMIDVHNKDTLLKTFQKLKELNKHQIVITLGDQGVIYEKDNEVHHIPAFQVNAIDTTGAGDIFHGAFTYFISHLYSLEDAIYMSSLTSAISVETLGGKTSIPTLSYVLEKANNLLSTSHTK